MAFYSGDDSYDFDTSWLDDFEDYDYQGFTPAEPVWQRPEEQFNFWSQPAPQDQPAPYIPTEQLPYRFQPQDEYVDPGTYMPASSFYEPQPGQEQPNPVTGAITRAGKGALDWAVNNPKDVLGAAIGAGMGIYGLTQQGGEVPKPDLSSLERYRAMLEAQAAKGSRVNDPVYEAAMRNIQQELDQPGGHDPRLEEQRKQERAQRQAYYQSRGLLGSDIANRELADFDRQTTSLLEDDAARRRQTRVQTFTGAAGAANPEQQTRTFSQLAGLGIQGAQMEQGAATSNAQLAESRRNQLLKTGGDIFGRSIATDPFEEERKRKASIDPRTGLPRTGM